MRPVGIDADPRSWDDGSDIELGRSGLFAEPFDEVIGWLSRVGDAPEPASCEAS
jgi:hypothetical protein